MLRFLSAALILFLVLPAAAQEYVPVNQNPDFKAEAVRIAEQFVVPRYEALAARFLTQNEAWKTYCGKPDDRGFEQLGVQFREAAEAWAAVELVRYGPISEDFRYERIAYWPERKNDVARGLARLLSSNDALTEDSMYDRSVAVQGMSALERLLYDEGAAAALKAGDLGAKRRCAAGQAISFNLTRVSKDVLTDWKPLIQKLKTGDEGPAREAVTRFGTDLLMLFQVVGDQKLDVPVGTTSGEAKPQAAQWWRSGLSNATIATNLKSAADLSYMILGSGGPGINTVGATETAQSLAESLPAPLPDMIKDGSQRSKLLLLRNAVRGARDLTTAYVPAALGIVVGFNSLDGD
ncbi:imelysin family protein [Flaviflagellibacter deserti]|uniref:Imelysin family protein n=1 Tax=Flaviflagellibacter deserti TaxID=2267266 RepID=A0ABV9Z2X7_9HYPH